MKRNRLKITMESRIHGDVYVRFGGERLETYRPKGRQGALRLACGTGKTLIMCIAAHEMKRLNLAQPFTVVSDNAEMYAYFSISENMLRRYSARYGSIDSMIAGTPEVGLQLNDGSLYKAKGRIETVSGVVDPVTGTVQIKALFPNPDRELLSGSIGNVILQNPKTEAVTIPMTATVELQDKIIAYRLKNGQAEAAYLTVDRLNDGNRFIVKEGLSVGDTIVAEGVGLVREGMSITPKNETK